MTSSMPFGSRVWNLGKFFVLVGALGATFLLFFGLAMRVALRVREVEVPSLQGRTPEEAAGLVAELGMTLSVDETPRPDERVQNGAILQQEPAAGASARRQRSIRVWLSAGPRATTIPDLTTQTERTAVIRLQNEGLDVALVSEIESNDYATDAVVSQDPPPSTRAPRVSLLVNRGADRPSYVMPDVIGTDGAGAAEVLRERLQRVALTTVPDQSGVPPGTVVRQQPVGGVRVSSADAVTLEVAR